MDEEILIGMHNYRGQNNAKIDYLKAATNPLKTSLGWPVTRLGGQDKTLLKESIRAIIYINVTLIRPLEKWTRTGNIQQTAILAAATGIFYAKESTIWRSYTSKMSSISTKCDPTYILQAQPEHSH